MSRTINSVLRPRWYKISLTGAISSSGIESSDVVNGGVPGTCILTFAGVLYEFAK